MKLIDYWQAVIPLCPDVDPKLCAVNLAKSVDSDVFETGCSQLVEYVEIPSLLLSQPFNIVFFQSRPIQTKVPVCSNTACLHRRYGCSIGFRLCCILDVVRSRSRHIWRDLLEVYPHCELKAQCDQYGAGMIVSWPRTRVSILR
jgi:hypothetical protein